MVTNRYYIKDSYGERGPFTPEELKQMDLPAETLVRLDGTDVWISYDRVFDAFQKIEKAPQHGAAGEMGLWDYYVHALKDKYATFDGRARRKEYWSVVLFNAIITMIINMLSFVTDGSWFIVGISAVVGLALIVPSISVTVRRLHDTGRGGGWWFIGLVPVVGWIVLLVFMLQPGEVGANRFGEDPKA